MLYIWALKFKFRIDFIYCTDSKFWLIFIFMQMIFSNKFYHKNVQINSKFLF